MEEFPPHVVFFPFMSKGHTIPLLHLARLFLRRRPISLTIFTTPSNHPFISSSISHPNLSIISLPFDSIIPGIESTDKLPSMSHFVDFANSTKLLQPGFEDHLEALPNLKLIVSDGFLPWTLDSANKLHVPRLAFYGMGYYATVVSRSVGANQLFAGPEGDDVAIQLPDFPWISLTRSDLSSPFNMRHPSGPHFDFVVEAVIATASSHGLLVNSFYELEPVFVDFYRKNNMVPRAWPVGPLCLAGPEKASLGGNSWARWMDRKLEEGVGVLYVSFGTQAEVSREQMREIGIGLKRSEVSFLWVVRPGSESVDGFGERGIVVRDWVDQRAVLGHEAVRGFMSHCGWNSVMESVCAGKAIVAWPMEAEQHLNARMVVEEMKIGVRVESCDGSVRGFVKADVVEKSVRELMEGETGETLRKKAEELGEAARRAMDEGGSSWLALESVLDEFNISKSTKAISNGEV